MLQIVFQCYVMNENNPYQANNRSKSVDVCETKNMDLFNKVHNFEPMKVHTFEPHIRLIRLFSLMLNSAKPRSSVHQTTSH